jgi:pimeloyl-ACP methyl ester carboxylesterase
VSTVASLRQLPLQRYAVRGASIAVSCLGESGDPVLFVPGYTGGKEDFVAVADDVVAAGFRYLAMDLRGQYESTGPPDAASFTIDALAADVRALVAAIGGPVHLVGHSFGGLVARSGVIAEPGLVRSLTLMASGPAALPETSARARAIVALEPVLHGQGAAAVYDVIEAGNAADPMRAPATPEVAAFMRRRFLAAHPVGLSVMGRALLDAEDRVAELCASGVPLLVCHGDLDDTWSPLLQTEMAERLGARHVVFAGAAHSPAVEAPVATAEALVDFWRASG